MKFPLRVTFTFPALQTCQLATAGFRWEINQSFSDEFSGNRLDHSKWHNHIPHWEGHPPGKFSPSSVSVSNGVLKLQTKELSEPEGDFSVACGAIQSKSNYAFHGYYECRMKAARLPLYTGFWMHNNDIQAPDGRFAHELIVQMAFGKSDKLKNRMKSNAMVAFKSNANDAQRIKAKCTNQTTLQTGVSNEVHTYGVWWVDPNTLKFYADGKHVYTINPSDEFGTDPFRHP